MWVMTSVETPGYSRKPLRGIERRRELTDTFNRTLASLHQLQKKRDRIGPPIPVSRAITKRAPLTWNQSRPQAKLCAR